MTIIGCCYTADVNADWGLFFLVINFSFFSSSCVFMPQSSKEKKPTELNPRTTSYEFLGPIGALGMVTILPLLVLFLATCCDATGYPSRDLFVDWKGYLQYKFSVEQLVSLFNKQVFMIYCGYVAALALFYIILPGDNVPGTVLRDGTRLKYKLNGINIYK